MVVPPTSIVRRVTNYINAVILKSHGYIHSASNNEDQIRISKYQGLL